MIKNWKSFNESKNYGDLYHSICWRSPDMKDAIDRCLNILKIGLKFNKELGASEYIKKGYFKFLKDYFYISITRIKPSIESAHWITLVLDGESISDKYKIEPFNRKGSVEIGYAAAIKNKSSHLGFDYEYLLKNRRLLNSRYCAEEKIMSKSEGYLNPKYIKEIILKGLDGDQIKIIKDNTPQNIKITMYK